MLACDVAWWGDCPPTIDNFKNIHEGETCLLVGNGPSLNEVPLGLLNAYPSIGSNTIFKSSFVPSYYVAIDHRVFREFSQEINKKYWTVPKFIPTPKLDDWRGPNIFRFDWTDYICAMHAQILLARYMGFSKLLMTGVDHTVETKLHFWGHDKDMPGTPNIQRWEDWYRRNLGDLLNISVRTELDVVPRGDWREYL